MKCEGDHCVTVWQTVAATGNSSQTTTGVPVGGSGVGVQTAAHTEAMPKELADATEAALEEAVAPINALPLDLDGDGTPDVTLTNDPDYLNGQSKGVLYVNIDLEKFPELMDGLRQASQFMSMQDNYYRQADEATPEIGQEAEREQERMALSSP